jgi:ribosomal protein S27AE
MRSVRRELRLMATVGTFSKPEEAQLLRSRLEAAGIPAFVRDELTIQMNWLYSTAIGGVRVEVANEHLEAAREILDLPAIECTEDDRLLCPRCGSNEVIRREWPRKVAYLSLLVASFPLVLSRKHSKCSRCGFKWK